MSRQNTVPSSDKPAETISALIPLWDMFNHHNGRVRLLFIYSCLFIIYYYDIYCFVIYPFKQLDTRIDSFIRVFKILYCRYFVG